MKRWGIAGGFVALGILLAVNAAQAGVSYSEAYQKIANDCRMLRNRASFTISSRCNFKVNDVLEIEKDGRAAVAITAYSKGILYDITFTAIYTMNNGSIGRFLHVRKDRFEGITGLSEWLLENAWDAMAAERPRNENN